MTLNIKLLCFALLVAVASAGVPWLPEPRTDEWWIKRHQGLLNLTHQHGSELKVAFLGDSITEGWAGNGKTVWKQHYATRHAFNYGIGGDRTEHVLYRLANGEFDKLNPKLVVLMIGTNNIGTNSAADIAKGIEAILKLLSQKVPHSKVLVLSVLPRSTVQTDTKVHQINQLISKFANNKVVFYHDLTATFETELAKEVSKLYVADKVHLTELGYQEWYKQIEPTFAKLIA